MASTDLLNPARLLQGGKLFAGQTLYVTRPSESDPTGREMRRLTPEQDAELDDLLYQDLTAVPGLDRGRPGGQDAAGGQGQPGLGWAETRRWQQKIEIIDRKSIFINLSNCLTWQTDAQLMAA